MDSRSGERWRGSPPLGCKERGLSARTEEDARMEWLDRLAHAFELDAPTNEEIAAVLDAARDLAHGVERRITPVSTFPVGMHVERRVAAGPSRREAPASPIAAPPAARPTRPAE